MGSGSGRYKLLGIRWATKDFSLVVKTINQCISSARDMCVIPGQGTKIPLAMWPKIFLKLQKKKKKGRLQGFIVQHGEIASVLQ